MTKITQEDIRLINNQLVDSRAKGIAGFPVKTYPGENLERTYCVFCHKEKGFVTQEDFDHVKAENIVVVCDDCFDTLGPPPGLKEANIQEVKK